jgi:hypothetical protein
MMQNEMGRVTRERNALLAMHNRPNRISGRKGLAGRRERSVPREHATAEPECT